MNLFRLAQPAVCLALAVGLSSCSMFGSKSAPVASAPVGAQEFDPFSNTWRPSTRVVVPPPSQPNMELAAKEEEKRKENTVMKKVGRSTGKVGSAVGNVGKTLAAPIKWIPGMGGKKGGEAEANEVDPNYSPAGAPQ